MKRRRTLTLEQLLSDPTGPDLTPYDMERISRGRWSDSTIRREIERGRVKAERECRGRVDVYWIAFKEAKRYALERLRACAA